MFCRLFCLSLLFAFGSADAQTARTPDHWALVQQLPAGKRIEIRTPQRWLQCAFIGADSASVSCHVHAVSSLLLSTPAHDETVSRADVDSLRTFGRSGAVTGAIGGVGAGLILGFGTSSDGANNAVGSLLGGLVLGFLGYAVGGLVDAIRYVGPHHPIYRRP